MVTRKGWLLEKNIEQILKLSGFNPKRNVIYKGYEIDVYLKYKNVNICIECKQYEKSGLTVRNLIHQWDSKNKELAKKYGIIIWDENKITKFLEDSIEKKDKMQKVILQEMKINPETLEGIADDEILEQTPQQLLIKEALEEIIRRGFGANIAFQEKGKDYKLRLRYSNGIFLMMETYDDESNKEIADILIELGFKEIEPVKKIKEKGIFGTKVVETDIEINELNEKQFLIRNITSKLGVTDFEANLGKNTNFIAFLIDSIFRKVYKAPDDYKLKIHDD